MEEQRDWVITTAGKVVRRDRRRAGDKVYVELYSLESQEQLVYNSFPDKEAAYCYRDKLIENYPQIFLNDELPQSDKTDTHKQKDLSNEEYQKLTRKKLAEYVDIAWERALKLKDKDFLDFYVKMLRFGYSAAPQEKPLNEEDKQRILKQKQAQTAAAIQEGIDSDFEEE